MKNRQPGQTTYHSKVTGKDIALKYANEPKVAKAKDVDKISPSQYSKEREMAKQNMAPAQAPRPVPDRNIPGSQNRLPSDRFTSVPTADKPSAPATKGVPSAADQMKTIDAAPKPDSYVPKAARVGREPSATSPVPEKSNDRIKGSAPVLSPNFEKNKQQPMQESYVSVGDKNYRIV